MWILCTFVCVCVWLAVMTMSRQEAYSCAVISGSDYDKAVEDSRDMQYVSSVVCMYCVRVCVCIVSRSDYDKAVEDSRDLQYVSSIVCGYCVRVCGCG
jgi:hypothetical protein